jgi:hypothetical protein
MTLSVAGPDAMKSDIASESARWKELVTKRKINAN